MLDYNIIFKSKYYSELYVEHKLYFEVLERFVKEKKSQMNGYETLRYKAFRKVKGLKFGSSYSGVPTSKLVYEKNNIHPKKSYIWGEIGEIYYDLPPPADIYKESFIWVSTFNNQHS